jgi:hypothetical protein
MAGVRDGILIDINDEFCTDIHPRNVCHAIIIIIIITTTTTCDIIFDTTVINSL